MWWTDALYQQFFNKWTTGQCMTLAQMVNGLLKDSSNGHQLRHLSIVGALKPLPSCFIAAIWKWSLIMQIFFWGYRFTKTPSSRDQGALHGSEALVEGLYSGHTDVYSYAYIFISFS